MMGNLVAESGAGKGQLSGLSYISHMAGKHAESTFPVGEKNFPNWRNISCSFRRQMRSLYRTGKRFNPTPDTPSAPARKAPYEPANGKNRHVGGNAARHFHARARENNRRKTCRYNKYGLPLYLESHLGGRLYTPQRGTICPLALRSQRPRAEHQRGEQTVLNKNGRSGKNYQS